MLVDRRPKVECRRKIALLSHAGSRDNELYATLHASAKFTGRRGDGAVQQGHGG
jgi:hypothetical protein